MYPHRPPRALRSLRASCARCTTPTPRPTRSALCSSGCGAAACSSTSGGSHIRLQPPSHTAAASTTYGCSLHPPSRTAAASTTYGCSLHRVRLQPPPRTAAASIVYGCSLCPSRVAASAPHGCRRRRAAVERRERRSPFDEHEVRFYAGCIVLGLEAMHAVRRVGRRVSVASSR